MRRSGILFPWRENGPREREIDSERGTDGIDFPSCYVRYQRFRGAAQRVSRHGVSPFSEEISETATVSWRATALPRLCDL